MTFPTMRERKLKQNNVNLDDYEILMSLGVKDVRTSRVSEF